MKKNFKSCICWFWIYYKLLTVKIPSKGIRIRTCGIFAYEVDVSNQRQPDCFQQLETNGLVENKTKHFTKINMTNLNPLKPHNYRCGTIFRLLLIMGCQYFLNHNPFSYFPFPILLFVRNFNISIVISTNIILNKETIS